jgi:hypothetical protein
MTRYPLGGRVVVGGSDVVVVGVGGKVVEGGDVIVGATVVEEGSTARAEVVDGA